MPDRFIVPFRAMVTKLLRTEGTLPVYGYLPDDVAHLPVYVVGRVSINESGTPAVMTLSLDVYLLGRRISDEDSQAELDAYGDELFDLLGGTRAVKVDDQAIRCTVLTAATVTVAGTEIAAYAATVAMDALSC